MVPHGNSGRKIRIIGLTMVILAVLALGLPLCFRDRPSGVSFEPLRRLRTQADQGTAFAPLLYHQITAAHQIGPTPDEVEGTVVLRTIFGLEVGTVQVLETSTHYDWTDPMVLILCWGSFLAVEAVLAGLLVRVVWNSP